MEIFNFENLTPIRKITTPFEKSYYAIYYTNSPPKHMIFHQVFLNIRKFRKWLNPLILLAFSAL